MFFLFYIIFCVHYEHMKVNTEKKIILSLCDTVMQPRKEIDFDNPKM